MRDRAAVFLEHNVQSFSVQAMPPKTKYTVKDFEKVAKSAAKTFFLHHKTHLECRYLGQKLKTRHLFVYDFLLFHICLLEPLCTKAVKGVRDHIDSPAL